MRIGLIAENARDWLALRSRRFPRPVFDVMGMMLYSRAVMAGVYFQVFDRLAHGSKTPAALAAEAGCDPHGMALLLDALTACGYLEEKDDGYRNARLGADWLRSDSPQTLANFVRFNYDMWEVVSHLEEYVQQGESRDIHETLDDPRWRNYMMGLRDLAALSAGEVVSKIEFKSPPRSLLDVGGGHSYYSVAMCRHYPALRATIVDLEPAARIGREVVAAAGLSDRIAFRLGHLAQAPFGENHDAAFVFNVLHHLDEETCRGTFRRLATALSPDGKLVVWESFREGHEQQRKDQVGSLLALYFGVTSRTQTYSFEQVAGWAREAGFRKIRREKLRTAPYAALLIATK